MKDVLSLLLVIGLVIAGWMNREKLGGLWTKAGATAEEAISTLDLASALPQNGAPTRHPAREAQAQVMALYPGLAIPNSALNQKFVALYKDAQSTDPALLSRPDWPIQLAEKAVISLGGAPMPKSAPVPAAAPARVDKQVVMYTASYCPACKQAKEYMAKKGIRYREIDVDSSLSGKEAFRKLGGNAVPLIMVGEKKMTGFNAQDLDRLLL